MSNSPLPFTRRLRIIAQDPMVKSRGKILTASVEVPAENLAAGPWGYRVQVIDYDSTTNTFYKPRKNRDYEGEDGGLTDPFKRAGDRVLLEDPSFHAQNVYAIAMRILARFEFALGRRVSWQFNSHQLKVAPHAFADANAFYSRDDESLLFGYFPGVESKTVFCCLSHDIVAHETTHALLDSLRGRYIDPSSPDQAAFHEGFSDVVALLSVFALKEVVLAALEHSEEKKEKKKKGGRKKKSRAGDQGSGRPTLSRRSLTIEALKKSVLFGLAEQMGSELSETRGGALRRSLDIDPDPEKYHKDPEFQEPHRRGEILVAAMLRAFLDVWVERIQALDAGGSGRLDRERVIEEGAKAADHLLTMSIRALDYCMPVHITFGDFLSALLTADSQICPDDSHFEYRRKLHAAFGSFGIESAVSPKWSKYGLWIAPEDTLSYDRVRFESLIRDPDEMFRFIWENRKPLRLEEKVYTRVLSVRPCMRIGPDGFVLRETVAEYMQLVELKAKELAKRGIEKPEGMPDKTRLLLQGGGTLIFDEFGKLKFNINNRIYDKKRQSARIDHMWKNGYIGGDDRGIWRPRTFAELHRLRSTGKLDEYQEGWN